MDGDSESLGDIAADLFLGIAVCREDVGTVAKRGADIQICPDDAGCQSGRLYASMRKPL